MSREGVGVEKERVERSASRELSIERVERQRQRRERERETERETDRDREIQRDTE